MCPAPLVISNKQLNYVLTHSLTISSGSSSSSICCCSVSQSASWLGSKSDSQSVITHSLNQSVNQPTTHSVSQLTNQPTNRYINQLTNQSVSQPVIQSITLQNFFCCRVGLPVARVGIKPEVATWLHPVALQWASCRNEGVWHREGQPPLATQW